MSSAHQCGHQGAVKQSIQQQRTFSKQMASRLSHRSEKTSSPAAHIQQIIVLCICYRVKVGIVCEHVLVLLVLIANHSDKAVAGLE